MGNGPGRSTAATVAGADPDTEAGAGPDGGMSAEPDGGVARRCGAAFRARIGNDARIQLAGAAQVLPAATAPVRSLFRQLDASRRWRPEVFTRHRALVRALAGDDLVVSVDALTALGTLLRKDPYADLTEVTTLRADVVDRGAVALLTEVRRRPVSLRTLDLDAASTGIAAVRTALDLLGRVDPAMRAEFDAMVAEVRLFGGSAADAFSSTRWFGCVYVAVPAGLSTDALVLHLLDHLTHEASHLGLYARMATDPLLLNGDERGFRAPIRPDARPLDGIFHAMFVLARVTRVFARLAAADSRPAVGAVRDAQATLFDHALATVEEHARLTAGGRTIVDGCRTMVDEALG
ncbi:MAG TPA: HEXXH motif-containing putative peptide modification protein [Cryptosporangiaceae bacterium]|nr:HEXXH motif-containing putative peptide modification protein [Cryptosporangiaceae bacterium]